MKKITLRFVGVRPLLMHNVELANPMSEKAKALKKATASKKKTDADLANIQRLEWFGGLVCTADGAPGLSADQLLGCMVSGAKKSKRGKEATLAIDVEGADVIPIVYDGPSDMAKLFTTPGYVDVKSVRIGQKRVMRTRPKFHEWSCDVTFSYDELVLNREDLLEMATTAGEQCGIGDYRPRYGRFMVEEI